MTKETMIWQTLSWVVASMVKNKTLPETKELFEEKVIKNAQCIVDYSEEEIKEVLYNTDVMSFTKVLSKIFN